jgi:hypothetical protein
MRQVVRDPVTRIKRLVVERVLELQLVPGPSSAEGATFAAHQEQSDSPTADEGGDDQTPLAMRNENLEELEATPNGDAIGATESAWV